MCWNASVSLKTWYFALFGFIIGLIGKQLPFSILLFGLLFSSMQLIEYYLWTNLNHEDKNKFYSKIAYIVILLEPLFALFIAHSYKLFSIDITKFLIVFYILYIAIFTKMNYHKLNFITNIGNNGHLDWGFTKDKGLLHNLIWFGLFYFGIFMTKNIVFIILGTFTLLYSLYKTNFDGTSNSLWCYYSNILWVYIIVRNLFGFLRTSSL